MDSCCIVKVLVGETGTGRQDQLLVLEAMKKMNARQARSTAIRRVRNPAMTSRWRIAGQRWVGAWDTYANRRGDKRENRAVCWA